MKLNLKVFYKLLVRPTVVISTVSPNGISNVAPFSWNSLIATEPLPLFGFSSNVKHDTCRNLKENGEFVVNIVCEAFGSIMKIMEKDFPYEVSEIQKCGLTEIKANCVKPPRIKEAYGWLESRMTQHVFLSDRNVWVIGELLEAEVKDKAFDWVVDVEKTKTPKPHMG